MISIRSARLGSRASLASFSTQLRRHRAITRTAIAAISLAITAAVSAGGAAQAGLAPIHSAPPSILPVNAGVGIATDQAVALTFSHAMDRASVEAALAIAPTQTVRFVWSDDGRSVKLVPEGLWATDVRYGIVVDETARNDAGALLGAPARFSFTTQTAASITEFGLHFVAEPAGGAAALDVRAAEAAGPPPNTASGVSAETSIQITFSAPVRREEAENAFLLSPAVPGIFRWSGTTLTYVPIERLTSDARYAVTFAGVHDLYGNPLGGDTSFSFTTRPGAQLVQTTPTAAATGVSVTEIALWFSQPMDPDTAGAALRITDSSSNAALTGSVAWNASHTQLRFTPARAFAGGHRFDVSLADGAQDADGNAVAANLAFTTKAAKRASVPRAGASSTLVGYALNQVNAARQAYGLKPLVYSTAIEAVALAHAWEQITYGYFSHIGRDGSTHGDRLRRAGLVFGWNGENQCYSYNGARSTAGTLDWCQSQFMSEPYPGVANHIGNILSTHYTKVGIGIAISGSKVIIVWDFTD